MALKYTGNSRTFIFEDTIYADPKIFDPKLHHHSYDTPIRGLSKERALRMVAQDPNIHSFEDDGKDLLEQATTPDVPDGDLSIVKPEVVTKKDGK